jgi:predicted nuclease of predicted toxin-antitoxin system
MKILLDECIDWRLAQDIVGHDIKTARQMGWTATQNGELLALVAREFDIFVTVDRNLVFQQNMSALAVAVIVLAAKSNRLADLKAFVPELLLLLSLQSLQPGKIHLIGEL